MVSFIKTMLVLALIFFGPSVLIHFHDKALSEAQDIPFQYSEVGFLLTKYAPPAEQMIRTSVSEEVFEQHVVPLMKQKAFGASVKAGTIMFVLFFFLELMKLWQTRERKSVRASLFSRAFERDNSSFKYKRRK